MRDASGDYADALRRGSGRYTINRPRASDWEIHSHQDQELVKGLGLTSATMLVMGSMIGSGIFIVSADIAREVGLARAADRRLAGDRLHDHHRRAQLWRTGRHDARAGGQYVYLREALGPLWGFLYGWTLFW